MHWFIENKASLTGFLRHFAMQKWIAEANLIQRK